MSAKQPMSSNQAIHNGYDFASVTPSDVTDLNGAALYIGTGGDVAVESENGNQVTFQNVDDGSWMPIRVNKVLATGTTATGIVAIY